MTSVSTESAHDASATTTLLHSASCPSLVVCKCCSRSRVSEYSVVSSCSESMILSIVRVRSSVTE